MNSTAPYRPSIGTLPVAFYAVAAAFIVALAVVGAVHCYSPVPYWDEWDGSLNFFMKVAHGDWSAWLIQPLEHRMRLTRIFFWLDRRLFRSAG